MKIVIGSDGTELQSSVAKRFGHAEYYIIFNTETKETEAVENVNEDHSHSVLTDLLNKGTEVFIVGNIGPHAFQIVSTGKTKIFLARLMTVEEAIAKFNNEDLEELLEPTVKKSIGHGHGHGKQHH